MTDDIEKRLRAFEEFMHKYCPLIDRMDFDLYNHGKDGMKTQLTKFIEREDLRQVEKKDTDERRSKIHFWLLGILSGLIVGLVLFLLNLVEHHHISMN